MGGVCGTHRREMEGDHLEDICVDGRIILKFILKQNRIRGCGLDSSGSGQGQVAGCCKDSN
jgi:hypothetical protein